MSTYLINKLATILEANLDKKDVRYFLKGKPGGPNALPKEVLQKGAIIIEAISNDTRPITTGINDQDSMTLKIILAKNTQGKFVDNAQRESGNYFCTRVMDGRNASAEPLATSIRYIIRKNQRSLGLLQPSLSIEYDTDELENVADGTITATMTLEVIDHYTQPIV